MLAMTHFLQTILFGCHDDAKGTRAKLKAVSCIAPLNIFVSWSLPNIVCRYKLYT